MWAKSNTRTRGQLECKVTWFCFCFYFVRSHTQYHLERGAHLKLDVQGQGGGRISGVDDYGVRGFENWTIFMDVICVSFLSVFAMKQPTC